MKGDFLLVKLGPNNFERFADYIKENRENFKTQLALISIKNNFLPILLVIDKIVRKQELQGFNQSLLDGGTSFISRVNLS